MADDQVNPVVSSAPETVDQDEQVDQVNTEPLRNASPLPESDTEVEEQAVALTRVNHFEFNNLNHISQYQAYAVFYGQRFGLHALLWLQVLWTLVSRVATTTRTVSLSVVRSLQTQLYVFFQGSSYPYRAQTTTLAGPGIAPIEWYYNADTKTFLSSTVYNSTNEYETHHLEWLAGEIKYNDLVLYDVSDFLQQMRWAGAERPSAALVMAAWSIHSGIVLNFRDGLILKTINEDGTEGSLPLRG